MRNGRGEGSSNPFCIHEVDAGAGELGFDCGDGAVQIDGAAGVADYDGVESFAAGVEGRVADAVIVGQAAEEDAREIAFAQVAGQAGCGGAVILEEGGVGVDLQGGSPCAG